MAHAAGWTRPARWGVFSDLLQEFAVTVVIARVWAAKADGTDAAQQVPVEEAPMAKRKSKRSYGHGCSPRPGGRTGPVRKAGPANRRMRRR